jgi:general secretion pathway protein C
MDITAIAPRRVVSALHFTLAALLILAVLLLARDTVRLVFTKDRVQAPPVSGSIAFKPERERKELLEYAPILENNVFGFPAGKPPILENNVFGFPAGKLTPLSSVEERSAEVVFGAADLKLVGAVAWRDGTGYAIVEGAGTGQEVFKTGDYIEGVGRLLTMEATSMLIETAEGEVRVPIKEMKPSGAGTRTTSARAARAPAKGKGPSKGFAMKTSENTYVVNQKAVDESLENPRNILTDARLLPRMVNGVQEGFVMREVRQGGIYDKLGLRNNDILLGVNDLQLSSPETALKAFTALRGMNRIELDVVRNGRKMTLTYTLR